MSALFIFFIPPAISSHKPILFVDNAVCSLRWFLTEKIWTISDQPSIFYFSSLDVFNIQLSRICRVKIKETHNMFEVCAKNTLWFWTLKY